MNKVLLINPNYYSKIFSRSKARAALSRSTLSLGLASAASSVAKKHPVKILDMNLENSGELRLREVVKSFKPDIVGITSTTPLIGSVYLIAEEIKKIEPEIIVIAGGPHPTALPEEVLYESKIDCVVKGEGDLALNLILEKGLGKNIPNIFYKNNFRVESSDVQGSLIQNLDDLDFPAYELFDIKRYNQPRISSRMSPVGYIETSRGCFGSCIFCNKNIHGQKLRMKSPRRVVDEMEWMLKLGFKEIHIIDDIFTADMNRAYQICDEIIRRKMNFPWYPRGGIRVDRVNPELLKIMKSAGCYRIPFGIESGSQRIIDIVKKNITLSQAETAIKLAKTAGLETECYFMLGLPGETEEDIVKTIEFAIKLDPDYAKFALTIPLPGTELFNIMNVRKQIKSRDWSKYNFAVTANDIYEHDCLSWEMLKNYYITSHRRFYFRSRFITRTIFRTMINKTLGAHICAFLKTGW